ncbi:hypothetical protein PIB30_081455 [Stylosanthes scabra]|uniref:Uncharacterized protein n=1 Tax=Stylosanthes scabra TaxID=79078 RepID=A0ABU6WPZ6_9FABA|nr:hypothetical protein [Stylosanthes scabra]
MSAPLFSNSGVTPGGPCCQTIWIEAAHSVSASEHRRDACSRRSLGQGGVVPGFPSGLHVPLDLPVYDLPAPQLHQPEDGHLPEVRPRGGRQIRVRNRRGGRAGRGRGQGPEQEPAQEPPVQEPAGHVPPVQEPPVQEPPLQESPMHPSEAGPSHGIAQGSPTDWYQSFVGDPQAGPSAQAGSSAQAVAFTPLSFQAPRRIDDKTSSESASHGDLRGSMRPYMSDTSSDAPGDDPPQGRGRRVRRPPDCGTGGCLEAPPAR